MPKIFFAVKIYLKFFSNSFIRVHTYANKSYSYSIYISKIILQLHLISSLNINRTSTIKCILLIVAHIKVTQLFNFDGTNLT